MGANEDDFGIVHRDVPRVLECLVACHAAIEQYLGKKISLGASTKPVYFRIPWSDEQIHWIVPSQPSTLLQTLETCIYSITTKYYAHLDRYQFNIQWVEKIQKFVDFKQ